MSDASLTLAVMRGYPSPMGVLGGDGTLRLSNPRWDDPDGLVARLVGQVPVAGDDVPGLLAGAGHDRALEVADLIREVLAGKLADVDVQLRLPPPDETVFRVVVSAIDAAEGRLAAVVCRTVDADVTLDSRPVWDDLAHERIEAALRRSEERYRAIFQSSAVGIALVEPDGTIVEANPSLLLLVGWGEETVRQGRANVLDLLSPHDRRSLAANLEQLESEGAVAWRREARLHLEDEEVLSVLLYVSPSRSEDDTARATLLVEDISERKRLEEQLRQAQRIESVGQLAGGIAHDFNNLVTVIRGHADLLLADMSEEDPLRPDLEEIREAGQRAAALTGQLLAFSRRNVLQPRVVNLNEVLDGMKSIFGRTLGEDAILAFDQADDLGLTRADATQIEQVLLNLVVNARDAMPAGGRLAIGTRNVELDQAFVRRNLGATPGPHVSISVADTGQGMEAETLARIFEPFFTTKSPGKGTGLGLAMVYGIVKQSGGYTQVETEPGQGTTFTIHLPRVQTAAPRPQPSEGAPDGDRCSHAILLVEDDPVTRTLAETVLRARGYEVITANDGQAAIVESRALGRPIDLLVTDVLLPGISGSDLAERLLREQPSLRVLFISGHTDEALVRHGVHEREMPFLPKPFTPGELAERVRTTLQEAP